MKREDMKNRVTIRDVAAAANVSVATVSYVLNGKKKVSEETRQKILAVIDELGFVPDLNARGLSVKDTKLLGVVVPQTEPGSKLMFHNIFYSELLGSIEYAAEHLGTKLIVVLGHTHCGAVDAAIHHDPEGYIKFITDEIQKAAGEETDPYEAGCLNVRYSMKRIEESLVIRNEEERGLRVVGAMYDIETGKAAFLEDEQ